MKPSLAVKQRSYDPPDRAVCIYCLEAVDESALTKEHIIPRALQGELVIQRAVCEPCRAEGNKRYENPALQSDLMVPRLLLDLRRRHKDKKKEIPLVCLDDSVYSTDDSEFNIRLEIESYPRLFNLMEIEPAGLLMGVERGGVINSLRLGFYNLGGSNYATPITTRHRMDHTAFSLTLAKIAYCFTCAERGLDGLTNIRDLLNGKRSDTYNFVGSALCKEFLTNRYLHNLYFRERGEYLTVLVHIFASCGATPYEIVVGKLSEIKA